MQTESFTIGARNGIAEILTISILTHEKLSGVFQFAFNTYAPVAILAQGLSSSGGTTYFVAQQGRSVDVLRLLEILGRNEEGWQLSDGIIRSPIPSKLSSKVVFEAVVASLPLPVDQ